MFVQQSSPIFYYFYFFSDEKSSPIFRYNKIKESLMCQNHGLKNREFSSIFWRNIGYWMWSKWNRPLIIDWGKNLLEIGEISSIFRWLADFSAKISSVAARVHEEEKASKKSPKKSTIFLKNHRFISNKLLINRQFSTIFFSSKRPILKKNIYKYFFYYFFSIYLLF